MSGENSPLLYLQNTRSIRPEERSHRSLLLGGALGLLSSLTFACNNYAIKTWKIDFVDVLVFRSSFQIILFGTMAKYLRQSLWPSELEDVSFNRRALYMKRFLLIFQGICGGLTMICVFLAVHLIPLGDALTLVFSNPLFTMLFSAIFLKHRLRLYKLTFALILIGGIILVVKPPLIFPSQNLNSTSFLGNLSEENNINASFSYHGALAGIGGALFGSFLIISVRCLKEFPHNVLIVYNGIGGFIDIICIAHFDGNSTIFYDWEHCHVPRILLVALIGISANLMAIKSYQMMPPAVASIIRSQEIVFAFIIQIVLMGITPNAYSLIGTGMIVASAIFVPFEEMFISKLPTSLQKIF